MAGMRLFVALVAVSVSIGGKWVGAQVEQVVGGDRAQVHHVVGDDRGWDPSTDIGSWSSGRIFRVGDKIWFAYSASQDKVVEVKSKEEFDACDVSNPIRMYTNGLDSVTLDGEGFRYFTSGKPETCRNGLKLHVEVQAVQPQGKHELHDVAAASDRSAVAVADGPAAPSASAHLDGLSLVLFLGLLICYLGH
ncbi:hypothetical protein U1Q18_010994 [Sarracenia purpurea var. burkii]